VNVAFLKKGAANHRSVKSVARKVSLLKLNSLIFNNYTGCERFLLRPVFSLNSEQVNPPAKLSGFSATFPDLGAIGFNVPHQNAPYQIKSTQKNSIYPFLKTSY